MIATTIGINQLQERLNNLMADTYENMDRYQEIYQLSQQLDELIIQYYREILMIEVP